MAIAQEAGGGVGGSTVVPLQDTLVKSKLLYSFLGEGNGTPLQYSCLANPMDGGAWWAAVHRVAKSWTRLSDFTFTFHFHALEKAMATHSSVFAWRIPGTGEPGGLLVSGVAQSRTRLKRLSSILLPPLWLQFSLIQHWAEGDTSNVKSCEFLFRTAVPR